MAKNKGGAPAAASKVSFKARPKKKLAGKPETPPPAPRLKTYYDTVVKPQLLAKGGSAMAVPRLTKCVISMGVGDANENPKKIESLMEDLEAITGQHPHVTRSRVSVANFKLREGMPVGCAVTLRKALMWEFLDRLIALIIPRLRDFRGMNPKSFDRRGNYNFGLTDQLVFPEINADKVTFQHGMNITLCTTATTDDEARELLRLLGFPFRDHEVVITLEASN
ncbi:MAG: 50S ribosomal protein L5 [Planctomycetota bacterium]